MRKFTFTLLLSMMTLAIFSQVPQSFKYQFIARDADGAILQNIALGIRISIHETTSGGPIIFQETFSETPNQFGLINLDIGTGSTTLGSFNTIDWSGGAKFIQTEITPGGGTPYVTMGTSQLLSVPFAMYSERSKDSPWELSGDNLYFNDGYVGIGIDAPIFRLDVRNSNVGESANIGVHTDAAGGALSAYSSSFPFPLEHFAGRLSLWSNAFTATGLDLRADGITSDIRLYTGGFGALNERMRIAPEGKVGIGTISPGYKLEVKSTGTSDGLGVTSSDGDLLFRVRQNSDGTGTATVYDQNGNTGIFLHGGAYSYFNAGDVGIGTTQPETPLHINNSTQFNPDLTLYGAKGSLLLTHFTEGIILGDYGPGISFSGINTYRRRAAIASVETSTDSDHVGLAFFTHPSSSTTSDIVMEAMRITHGGNLGIGQASPETMLHVTTDTKFNKGNYSGREKGALLITQIGGMTGYHQYGAALSFSGINTSRRRAAIAAIQSGFDDDEVGLAIFTSPGTTTSTDAVSQAMVITHDGLVGINTTTPYYRLDVTGNIAVRDEATGIVTVEIGTGLDYAEGFDVAARNNIGPGTVLCIDPDNPGKLKISEAAYDTKVAGIVAGANDLGSGVTLGTGQFDFNVALAGRVYCNVDASEMAVEVGDLLTTSDLAGYARKVTDPGKAHGAILGKAMQSLEKGEKGQVLVLVTLQ